jgi:hypothetical protein
MGYPTNLKVVSRQLTPNTVIASCAFSRVNKLNFGARMALFNYENKIVVWSAIPYCQETIKSLQLLTGSQDDFNITHLIIPDREHTMAAQSFKEAYPNLKVIAMESALVQGVTIDYLIKDSQGGKLLNKESLQEIGITDSVIVDNFEFVYLPHHNNKELVMFDKNSKILYEADLLFNLGIEGTLDGSTTLEQYSPETGYEKGFKPHTGWSYMTRYMQPKSKVGNFLAKKVVNMAKSKQGLQHIYDWEFHTIVMCHGNLIDKDAKQAFKSVFPSVN